ncbi:MAG: hypothetical protein IPN29_04660 [Saprospiraceae bacterium]|nr:hypothetical protein [Saprospiraceae bacterium]
MKHQFLIFTTFLLFHMAGCENNQKKEIQQLHNSVMAVHDGVMPKMDDIHDARKKLKASMDTGDSIKVFMLLKQLDDADEAMMVWMEDFNSSFESMPIQEQRKYLDGEMLKINRVRELMLNAIDSANQHIKRDKLHETR